MTAGAASLARIHAAIERDAPAHLAKVQQFLRQPSISSDGNGIAETAELVRRMIVSAGGSARLVRTPGHPVVVGAIDAGRPRTLLIYGMYDVQPVEGEDWIVPPFGGELVELPEYGKCLVSRGVYNTKGPLRGFFNAIEAIKSCGALPVNLKFLIEGEEENGSRNLPEVVEACADELASDAVYFPWYSLNRSGRPVLYLGVKGFAFFELSAAGNETGGPVSRAIHGLNATWISSPVWRLVHALGSLVAENEVITVDGFYDRVRGADAEDLLLLSALATTFDQTLALAEIGARRFKVERSGADLLRHHLFSPTLNIDGLLAGYTGPGGKNILPNSATAKLDVRLVPDMTVADTVAKLRTHLDRHGFADIALRVLSSTEVARTSVNAPAIQALLRAYRRHGYEAEIWPHSPGSAPFALFTDRLGLPLVMGGLGQGGRAHSNNEYGVVRTLPLFEKSVASYLFEFAA
jgi:acetylornithine deacetylase/succinyl-diaminopimelate desuccinylase-like protein